MNAPTPFAIIGHAIEKTHLLVAGIQYLDWYRLPLPYDHWVQAAALIPLATFGTREALPFVCNFLGHCCAYASKSFFAAATIPQHLSAGSAKIRKWIGKALQAGANYLLNCSSEAP